MPMTMQRSVRALDVRKQGGRTSEVFWRALKQMGRQPRPQFWSRAKNGDTRASKGSQHSESVASAAQPAGSAVTPASRSSTVDGARDDNRSTTPSGSGSPAPHTTTLSQPWRSDLHGWRWPGRIITVEGSTAVFQLCAGFCSRCAQHSGAREGEGAGSPPRHGSYSGGRAACRVFCPGTSVSQLRLDV